MIQIASMETGPLSVNTYIVGRKDSKERIVIDPGESKKVMEYLNENGLKCTHILLTHGHFDHILGVAVLQEQTGAQIFIHEKDGDTLSNDKKNLAAYVHTTVDKCEADRLLADGDTILVAGMEIKVLYTPGHSRGSVCYVIEEEKIIFSGDTLFHLSVGRADLYRSNKSDLAYSILYKLYQLHGDYVVLPGHGEKTSLEFERLNNPVTSHMDYE